MMIMMMIIGDDGDDNYNVDGRGASNSNLDLDLGLAQVWDDESNIDDDDDDGDSASGTHRCLVMMRPTMLWMTSQLHWMFRTHRMLTWLGGGRAVARVRVPRPRPQLRHQVGKSSNLINKSSMHCRRLIFQQSPRYQPTAQAFRPNSVQVKFA